MKKVNKKDFIKFLEDLSVNYRIIAPADQEKGFDFYKIEEDFDKIEFDFVNTDRSFKRFIYGQTEKILDFKENKMIIEEPGFEPQIIVGVKNCDLKSLKVLDYNFLEKDPIDTIYKRARDNTIIIGAACTGYNSTCFCKSFDIDPTAMDTADLNYLFDKNKNAFFIQANSEKGKQLLKELNTKEATDFEDIVKEIKKDLEEIEDIIGDNNMVKVFSDKLEDDRWNEIFKGCINCGICTFYCPTCYCFDIQEEGKFWEGSRVRNWDSCMFPIYTKETSGHNPRPTLRERYRNRVLHKFYYQLKHNEEFGCVGCGRCIINCPTNIDIREIIKTFI